MYVIILFCWIIIVLSFFIGVFIFRVIGWLVLKYFRILVEVIVFFILLNDCFVFEVKFYLLLVLRVLRGLFNLLRFGMNFVMYVSILRIVFSLVWFFSFFIFVIVLICLGVGFSFLLVNKWLI